MPILSFLRRPKPPAPPATPLPYTRLTLEDWKNSPERVAYAAELLRNPLFLDLVGMLSNVRPLFRGEWNAHNTAVLLGQRIGHDQIIATILEAGKSPAAAPQELPPADYGAANTMAQWENGTAESTQ